MVQCFVCIGWQDCCLYVVFLQFGQVGVYQQVFGIVVLYIYLYDQFVVDYVVVYVVIVFEGFVIGLYVKQCVMVVDDGLFYCGIGYYFGFFEMFFDLVIVCGVEGCVLCWVDYFLVVGKVDFQLW